MTEKLYYADPSLCVFDARVTRTAAVPEGVGVILDRTCFYPGGGGQPADRGTLGGAPVLALREEGDEVVHVLAGPPAEGLVRGELDAAWRRDYMAQHTGQHILSRSLIEAAGKETVSVHFGEETTTIEISAADITDAELARAEDIANTLIKENRRVLVHEVDAADAGRFPLRRAPPKDEPRLRILEVEGFDWAACSGVHVAATGEIFLVKIVAVEKIRGRLRLHAMMGRRALADYGRTSDLARELSRRLTCGIPDVLDRVEEFMSRDRERAREMKRLGVLLAGVRAAEAVTAAFTSRALEGGPAGSPLFVGRVLEEGGAEALSAFMDAVLADPGRLCAAAVRTAEGFLWAVGHSAGEGLSLEGLKSVIAGFGARGGGRGTRMQGSAPGPGRAQEFIDAAREAILRF